jgi:hypothetical protein
MAVLAVYGRSFSQSAAPHPHHHRRRVLVVGEVRQFVETTISGRNDAQLEEV